MINEIVDMVSNCGACMENRNYHACEELIHHNIPSSPWEKVGTDLFQLKGKDYLVVVDCTSKYFEVSALPNTLASMIIQHTKSIFARFGIPKIVVSDNEPQYSSYEYKRFEKKYPKSNGLVERTIQTVKKTIKKCLKSGDDPCLSFLAIRLSPGADNSPSPAFKLMNRHLRTPLPSEDRESITNFA